MPEYLAVLIKADGVWLRFVDSYDREALINIESLASKGGPIVEAVLIQWCADRRNER